MTNETAIWTLINSLEAEYLAKREAYGRGFGQQDEARALINRIDRLRGEAVKLSK